MQQEKGRESVMMMKEKCVLCTLALLRQRQSFAISIQPKNLQTVNLKISADICTQSSSRTF